MKIAVCSLFRDSNNWYGRNINQVDRFFKQLVHQTHDFNDISLFLLEGDSQDNTRSTLEEYATTYGNLRLYHVSNQYGKVASIEGDNRMKGLSALGNRLLNEVQPYEPDYVLWLESDLIILPNLINELVGASYLAGAEGDMTIVAPLIYLAGQNIFYDTWGFRELDGKRWVHNQKIERKELREMSSIGSCAMIDGRLIQAGVRFGEGAFIELCKQARDIGGKVYVDTSTKIYHPGSEHVYSRWI